MNDPLQALDVVDTIMGPIPRKHLKFEEQRSEDWRAVYTKHVWTFEGKVVREDGWVALKTGLSTEIQRSVLNG